MKTLRMIVIASVLTLGCEQSQAVYYPPPGHAPPGYAPPGYVEPAYEASDDAERREREKKDKETTEFCMMMGGTYKLEQCKLRAETVCANRGMTWDICLAKVRATYAAKQAAQHESSDERQEPPRDERQEPPRNERQEAPRDEQRELLDRYLNVTAFLLFKAAWPSADYLRYEFRGVGEPKVSTRRVSFNVKVRLYGRSNITGNSIWVDAVGEVIERKNDRDKWVMEFDYRWGDYDAGWPPGATVKLIREIAK